jgi:hypothetical protein
MWIQALVSICIHAIEMQAVNVLKIKNVNLNKAMEKEVLIMDSWFKMLFILVIVIILT